MNKAYKFRIYPGKKQEELLAKTFGCCRFLYNIMLDDKIKEYEVTKKMKETTPAAYKKEYPWLKEVDSLALANVQLLLEKAYKNFFCESVCGFSKIQVQTSKQEELYNECREWKYSFGKWKNPASETEGSEDQKALGNSG